MRGYGLAFPKSTAARRAPVLILEATPSRGGCGVASNVVTSSFIVTEFGVASRFGSRDLTVDFGDRRRRQRPLRCLFRRIHYVSMGWMAIPPAAVLKSTVPGGQKPGDGSP